MWYTNNYRRHLCDMHIDDWNEIFLSEFSPEEYLKNLKKAKIQNAMLYFQSHVGLCHYPTKTGKMHKGFRGKEDAMQRLAKLCRKNGITVTGYYSLIFNNWAHDTYPEWRMVGRDGKSSKDGGEERDAVFVRHGIFRYGFCCPNNNEYRDFVVQQIKEMANYFEFDGMFFDMPFWDHFCYCDACKKRWEKEVGGELPAIRDWNDPKWLLHVEKRRQWMGEFTQFVTNELKRVAPHASVEYNMASAAYFNGERGVAEEVLEASDYAGGDIYGDIYSHSFVCKLYKNATKNPPFENMVSRCTPDLVKHTTTKSEDTLCSAVMVTAAHHGATLMIDAINPVGTLDERVYDRIGKVFAKEANYEKYFEGDMIEDIGIYYSLRSKFNSYGENWCNHGACVNMVKTMIINHIPNGVAGSFQSLEEYQILMVPQLTEVDAGEYERIIDYVRKGGQLYLSGGECHGLLKEFFDARIVGRTKEKVVYIAPDKKAGSTFDYFNEKYPMHFDGTAPIAEGIDQEKVIATVTLPYTNQDTATFASIHSNPPGIATQIPAVAVTEYGAGKVIWSALPIEEVDMYDYRRVLLNLFAEYFTIRQTIKSDAPKDVEITGFRTEEGIYLNAVLLNEDYKARRVEPFRISVRCDWVPSVVRRLSDSVPIEFEYEEGYVSFLISGFDIFEMYKVVY